MQKFRIFVLFFIVYISCFLGQSKKNDDDIIIMDSSDDSDRKNSDPIENEGPINDNVDNPLHDNIQNSTSNRIQNDMHNMHGLHDLYLYSWYRGDKKAFYAKIAVFIFILIIVIANAIISRKTNKMIALYWLRTCKDIFLQQFAKIGDDKSFLLERSYHNYDFQCTGRKNCNYYFVNLSLIKRQCIWRYYLLNYFVNQHDTMYIAVNFDKLDKNVLCVYKKHQKKNIDYRFPNINKYTKLMDKSELKKIYDIKADSSEIVNLVLSGKILNFLNTYDKYINYMCITDIPLYDVENRIPEKKEDNKQIEKHNFLFLSFVIPKNPEDLRTLINFSIYMIDACHCIDLSEKTRDNVKKIRSIVEKEDERRKQELRELQEKKKAKKLQEENEKLSKMSPEQQRKYEEKKQKKNMKKMKKFKIIKI
ncbi:hypothetical protein YYC_02714 [Plasmodium yoelii 17X]|uniref:DUF1682 domain-containing protein n=4 Tax=Plasmodium yoelii TaxID=5861 RepID=A0AAE9WU23_PLAYO|nr:conserved protein, unknown function [Plasmodium yoelii]EAA18267.1 hypothetical protein [Plasmodium yoelii yoelii]ETB60430.1 hypothetical protein YYC_02714 [Plasmodium yoelii 17X]WBY56599.1 hypothetical protein Py17XNL_000801660 [Plasmodium yoelii yoelii]CDU17455.1 conserved protein, unknown function [Plasmodium yoelii]VTZ77186.1 conserved protein, unknown function [Plasmodium yoelii]|eukprot:XP_726702.1 conserved protein, unknown function [Plasmodium yoelii]